MKILRNHLIRLRNLSSEKKRNLRNSPVLEKTHRFLYSDTECIDPLHSRFRRLCVLYLEHEYVVPFLQPTNRAHYTAGKTQRASHAIPGVPCIGNRVAMVIEFQNLDVDQNNRLEW